MEIRPGERHPLERQPESPARLLPCRRGDLAEFCGGARRPLCVTGKHFLLHFNHEGRCRLEQIAGVQCARHERGEGDPDTHDEQCDDEERDPEDGSPNQRGSAFDSAGSHDSTTLVDAGGINGYECRPPSEMGPLSIGCTRQLSARCRSRAVRSRSRYPEPMDETEPSPHEGRDELSIDTPDRSRAVRLARWFLPPYLIAVGLIVFLPAHEARRVTGLVGWIADVLASLGASREVSAAVVEFLANIALFVPMGVLLALAFPTLSWWVVLAVGCLATIGIELVQLALPTRYSTLSDIIANTTGTALGLLLLSWWARARQRRGSDRSPT
ncbi:hypothetical protein DCE94_00575 [Agromyces badenianii]|nr:hypothetical protein DCE94_00575 [Agromyces badenianii]